MRRAWKVSSGTAIAAAMEVSLNSEMKVEPSAGSALRNISGRRISSAILARRQPDRTAGVDEPDGNAEQAGAENLGQIGAGVKSQRGDETLLLAQANAQIGKAK